MSLPLPVFLTHLVVYQAEFRAASWVAPHEWAGSLPPAERNQEVNSKNVTAPLTPGIFRKSTAEERKDRASPDRFPHCPGSTIQVNFSDFLMSNYYAECVVMVSGFILK